MAGKGWIFSGLSTDSYLTEYQRKANCYSHDTLDEIVSLDETSESITLAELLERARALCGEKAEIELSRDVLEKLVCPKCGHSESLFQSLGNIRATHAVCPNCNDNHREPVLFNRIRGNEAFLSSTPAQIGLPPMDIVIVRGADRSIGLELSGDAPRVLGPLAEAGLEWV
jgi:adenylyltransferase/sulfurtransferase